MQSRTYIKYFIIAAGICLGNSNALADGIAMRASQIPTAERQQLMSYIKSAKKEHPDTFKAVEIVRNQVPEMDAVKRGRFAPVTPMFKALGREAILPMINMLAFEGPSRENYTDTAWTTLRASLIEAIGSHRDPLARPVLTAILDSNEKDFYVIRAAAEALAKLSQDQDAAKLVKMARINDHKQKGVLAGMGACRRAIVAQELAAQLDSNPASALANAIIDSLGHVGSSWAWKTTIVKNNAPTEEAAVRKIAAEALVKAYVKYTGSLRQSASDSLMMIDEPSTPSLIATAKRGATPELTAALDKLAQRFSRNPIR